MSTRPTALALLAAVTCAPTAFAAKLDQDSQKWLEGVAAIVLPEEAKTYGQLRDRAERVEFERIFWARRDPDVSTAENEYEARFTARRTEADRRFLISGTSGSATGCGRLLILLGEPDAVRHGSSGAPFGNPDPIPMIASGVGRSGATQITRFPPRQPEVWTYKSRPEVVFEGGRAEIDVDARCAVHPGVTLQLERIAAGRVMNPGLAYRVSAGRIVRLADLLPKPGPAQELLQTGRQDFAVAGQHGYIRAEGATALIGLLRVDGAALALQESAGTKTAEVTVAAQVVSENGHVAAADERRVVAPVDGADPVLLGYRLFLRPGRYTLRYGVLDAKSSRGGSASEAIDVPDLNGPDLSAGTLWVVRDIVEGASSNRADPLDVFVLGSLRLRPRFGNVFAPSETAHFFYSLAGSVDPATGKSDLTVGLSLLKGRNVVASTPNESFAERYVVTSVGPVALQYPPGAYTARLKVKDNLTQKETTVDQAFEIK